MRMVINLTDVQELVSLQAIPTAKDSIAAVCQEICAEASDPFEQAGVTLCFESDCIGHKIAFNRDLIEKLLLHETDEDHALSSTDIIPVDLNIKHRPQKAPKRGARFCENPQKIVPTWKQTQKNR